MNVADNLMAYSMGGMTGAIVTSPFDVVKTRLQSDMFRHSSDEGVRHAAEVARKGGSSGGVRGIMWQFVDTVYLIKWVTMCNPNLRRERALTTVFQT